MRGIGSVLLAENRRCFSAYVPRRHKIVAGGNVRRIFDSALKTTWKFASGNPGRCI